MSRSDDRDMKKRKAWTKPILREIELTEEERAALLTAEHPFELLQKMKPNLG